MSLQPSQHVSDSKRRKGWFGFPLALEKHWKVFLLAFTNDRGPRPLSSSQLPGCSHACSGRRGLLLAWIQLEVEEEKPIRKETFHPSLGTETKGKLCFLSLSAKNLVTLRKLRASSLRPAGEGSTVSAFTPLVRPDHSSRARRSEVVLSKRLLF